MKTIITIENGKVTIETVGKNTRKSQEKPFIRPGDMFPPFDPWSPLLPPITTKPYIRKTQPNDWEREVVYNELSHSVIAPGRLEVTCR